MKKISLALLAVLALSCKKAPENADTIDTLMVSADTLAVEENADGEDSTVAGVVNFNQAWNDPEVDSEKAFPPFEEMHALVKRAFDVRDSLAFAGEDYTVKDSLIAEPFVVAAYEAIQKYKAEMTAGISLENVGNLFVQGELNPDDRSSEYLPPVRASSLLADEEFFFLGGAPFVMPLESAASGDDGKSRMQFVIDAPANAEYLFNSIYRRFPGPVDISFGGPIWTYEGPQKQIRGIGSIIHRVRDPISVWLITEKGAVEAELVAAELPLADKYGCQSDYPSYTFQTKADLNANDILAVFVSYGSMDLDKLVAKRENGNLWTADLNGDSIPDIACVSSTTSGASSDALATVLWFMNVNGRWIVMDYGSQPDCT